MTTSTSPDGLLHDLPRNITLADIQRASTQGTQASYLHRDRAVNG
jgi:hypothetical protein